MTSPFDDISELDVLPGEIMSDFGRLARGLVRASVRPRNVAALREIVRRARAEGWRLAARSLGLSQSGQSIANDGISVDMGAFDGFELRGDRVRCGTALTWRSLVSALAPHGLAPEVVPLNLDLSVGGTLSAGGMGTTSHRYGMAVSAVEGLEVVTAGGDHIEATRDHAPEVLDAFLGGVGSFGFMTAAVMRLRPTRDSIHTTYLLHDDFSSMLANYEHLAHEPNVVHIEGFASAAIQGLRFISGRRVPFARWFYGLQISVEQAPGAAPSLDWLSKLAFREIVGTDETNYLEHASRYDLRFQVMRATGAWEQPHPWFECMLPRDAALRAIPEIIPQLPLALGDGHRILLVGDTTHPSLLMRPEAPVVGLAVLPMGVQPAMLSNVLPALRLIHDQVLSAGGKRYLSGWLFEPDEDAWRRHYGDAYDRWLDYRRTFDPDGIMRSYLR